MLALLVCCHCVMCVIKWHSFKHHLIALSQITFVWIGLSLSDLFKKVNCIDNNGCYGKKTMKNFKDLIRNWRLDILWMPSFSGLLLSLFRLLPLDQYGSVLLNFTLDDIGRKFLVDIYQVCSNHDPGLVAKKPLW